MNNNKLNNWFKNHLSPSVLFCIIVLLTLCPLFDNDPVVTETDDDKTEDDKPDKHTDRLNESHQIR